MSQFYWDPIECLSIYLLSTFIMNNIIRTKFLSGDFNDFFARFCTSVVSCCVHRAEPKHFYKFLEQNEK